MARPSILIGGMAAAAVIPALASSGLAEVATGY